MFVSRLKIHNWRNFREAEAQLQSVTYVLGPNASGKSNFLDVFRFLRDVAKPTGGGLQKAISQRGGLPKVRCLHARSHPQVSIDIELAESSDATSSKWRYEVAFTAESSGRRRIILTKEVVTRYEDGVEDVLLSRPDADDRKDRERLTQTALEQIQANASFRSLADQLARSTYLHVVPQLLKFADEISGRKLEDDPFGQGFLDRISATPDKTRKARLARIESALRGVIPKFSDLEFVKDEITGQPHLEIKYKHHRPRGARQREDQFSDGTLRLISLLWLLMDGDSLLLLEEPELSLDETVVAEIPNLIHRIQKMSKRSRQIIISTHSEALLSNAGIDGKSLLILEPSDEGTTITMPRSSEIVAMNSGFSPAEVVLQRAQRGRSRQLDLSL